MTRTVEDRCRSLVAEHLGVSASRISETTDLADDLGADSLDQVEMVMGLEDEFQTEITDDMALQVRTFGELVRAVESAI